MADAMLVQVAYALSDEVFLREVRVPVHATVADALARSGLDAAYPGLDLAAVPVGIHGRKVKRTQVLREGDRVEVYRPLQLDPMQARRQRAGRNAR